MKRITKRERRRIEREERDRQAAQLAADFALDVTEEGRCDSEEKALWQNE